MEHKLSVQSRQDFDTKLKKLLNPMASLIDKKFKKFDELFENLLNFSQRSFNQMFEKTYGVMYLQNSYIFTDLFKTFDDYYTRGEKDMRQEMENFFRKLYQKIFTVYNSQYTFSGRYLECVNSHMNELKPFGDDPEKLTTNIKRSFVAFRSFVQGLKTAASVVRNVLQVNPSVSCVHELIKMTHCSTCAGHQGVKPCLPFCLHVQELCLAHHLPLAKLWPDFVDAMQKLGDRLEGPFNIGHEVPPINLKISNAIMNFQESGLEISNKVFQGCGQPTLGRQTRSTRGELNFERLDFSSRRSNSEDDALRGQDEALTKLIREIKTKIKNSKNFWSELPAEMCKEARNLGPSKCWTGKGLGKYDGSSLLNLTKEVHSPQMDEQVFRLKLITSKLREAYHGRDVSWIDEGMLVICSLCLIKFSGSEVGTPSKREPQDDEGYEGSGSGWVTGSPTRASPGAQYPPDDEDGYQEAGEEEGSGDEVVDDLEEGSGMDPVYTKEDVSHKSHNKPPIGPYDDIMAPPQTPRNIPPVQKKNPSAAPAEKPMSLTWAVAVYLLPAVFTFLGTIG
ncbi:Glypican-4 [Armadillidium vulgare]|nr:Glypican-4 [Armadillidium vulgare]